jgi:hypothetical protein
MGPRTARVGGGALREEISPREVLQIDVSGVDRTFDPRVPSPGGETVRRFAPLLEEWGLWPEGADGEDCREAVEAGRWAKLVGLGPGLTPAGDDFLAGAAIGSFSMGGTGGFGGLPEGAGSRHDGGFPFSAPDLSRTTWLSASILRDALEGRTWARGKSLIEAIGRGDGEAVLRRSGEILDFGHTSGRAWLAGFARGLLMGIRRENSRCSGSRSFEASTTTA